jgi:hypothetical protein
MEQPQTERRHLGGSFVPKTTGETPALRKPPQGGGVLARLRAADTGEHCFF